VFSTLCQATPWIGVTVNALGVVSVPGRASEPCCVFCLFGWCFKKVADELKLPPGSDDVFVYN
jgi:hypothetical protein